MNKQETITMIAAILTSLHEADSGTPESMLYILCNMDMEKWNYIRGIMLRANWVSIKGNYVTLMPEGTKMAIEINNALKAKQ